MNISQYRKEYTSGEFVGFSQVLDEAKEFLVELVKLNRSGMKEEMGDVFHFTQLWLHSRFKIDGEVWSITKHSVEKFMSRKHFWQRIYEHAGLPKDISNFMGNYKKREKVVKHLEKFGIEREKAEKAHKSVVCK